MRKHGPLVSPGRARCREIAAETQKADFSYIEYGATLAFNLSGQRI